MTSIQVGRDKKAHIRGSFSGRVLMGILVILGSSLWFHVLADESKTNNSINAVNVADSESTTTVSIRGDREPTFTLFRLSNPTRIFIDVANASLNSIEKSRLVRNGVVGCNIITKSYFLPFFSILFNS